MFRFLSFEVCEKREVLSWVCEVSDRAAALNSWTSRYCICWYNSNNDWLVSLPLHRLLGIQPDKVVPLGLSESRPQTHLFLRAFLQEYESSVPPRSVSSALCSEFSYVLTGCPCRPLGNPWLACHRVAEHGIWQLQPDLSLIISGEADMDCWLLFVLGRLSRRLECFLYIQVQHRWVLESLWDNVRAHEDQRNCRSTSSSLALPWTPGFQVSNYY